MNQKENKKNYLFQLNDQKNKVIGWPRCYKRAARAKKNLWQTIRAMLF